MKVKLLRLLLIYVATILVFIAAKVVFMLCNAAGHDVVFSDYFTVIGHGLTLDLSTALYFLIVPLLVSLAEVWVRLPSVVMKVYYGIVSAAFSLSFVADTSLYQFWEFKLDASCLQYLEQPEGITASVSVGYLLVRFLLVVSIAVSLYMLYNWVAGIAAKVSRDFGKSRDSRLSEKLKATALHVLLMPMMVIGIRGGLSESTTNVGQVYYSQNQFLNHAAINPVFNFLYSLFHGLGDLSQYQSFGEAERQELVADVFSTMSVNVDTLLTTTRPDVVIILMESAGEQFADAMPRLQQLKQEGVNFSRCYANSWRTDRGTLCALSGYPSFPTLSVMKMPEKSRHLPGIARTLAAQGYETSYLYGGDINFTNMRSYLISNGWQRLTSMDDFTSSERSSANWGVRDDITFNHLYHQISDFKPQTSYLIGFSTLSSHEPWDVPTKKHQDEVLNAFAYLDDCLCDFIDRLKETPQWQNLLIVITADHGISHAGVNQNTPLQKNHIPMLWVGGAVREPRTVDFICNQSDLCATLLGQMQLPHGEFLFSRDVMSTTYVYPTAFHNYSNVQLMVDSTGYVLYDFDAGRIITSEGNDLQRLERVNKAVLQTTVNNLKSL